MPTPVSTTRELEHAVAGRFRESHPDLAALGREFQRVGDQVQHHLLQRPPVGVDSQEARAGLYSRRLNPRLVREQAAAAEATLVTASRTSNRSILELVAVGLDLRHVEHVVDQVGQVPPEIVDQLGVLAVAVGDRPEQPGVFMMSEKPRMAFSGVRSSWLLVAEEAGAGQGGLFGVSASGLGLDQGGLQLLDRLVWGRTVSRSSWLTGLSRSTRSGGGAEGRRFRNDGLRRGDAGLASENRRDLAHHGDQPLVAAAPSRLTARRRPGSPPPG